ncbi:MAG: arsenite methyltransferase [Deltaproteobacteria bacterium]|nr:arsenite methyltransferase [Deltaproteobacteria bacterium]MBW2072168.1 arsenite methyltransferase [Deltaproteobacteria bacterium]
MRNKHPEEIRTTVLQRYGDLAKGGSKGCGCTVSPSCCGSSSPSASEALGYSVEELSSVPEGSNMGLGCGNPQAIAALKPGETVVDLGSGGGFDCFLAAARVGKSGRVIGVDMTPEMVNRARENARQGDYTNVEFRLGEIEHLPVADNTADVIISNCVINLSPDKQSVFQEAYRILKPGGRLAISDVVATASLPPELRDDLQLLSRCIAGAVTPEEITGMLQRAGFREIRIQLQESSREVIKEWIPGINAQDYVVSATIEAVKP